ncbi:MAG TPA: MoaD/ThiS family protein [Streptosporangiaceae bacterium]|nr:MoaD/ThiS family protein [Streptosporangiaceae bacterium]
MAIVTMRYWAAAKEAAGVAEETVTADTLAAALTVIGGERRENPGTAAGASALSTVLARSSFLIDGHPVGLRAADSVVLADGAVIEVLPPFAGG